MVSVLPFHDDISLKGNRPSLQRQLTATDRQIGKLVYELYGLTDDEIKIVEEGTAGSAKTTSA